MKRLIISLLIVAMMMVSCTTVQAAEVVANESPAEFESRMAARVRTPSWTTHDGSMRDPVALGQYGTWGIYHENRLLEERTDYEVTMNINYSVRGEKAKQLYEYYLREEAEYSTYSYFTPETTSETTYTPKRGNELMIINLTFGVESEETTPLPLKPTDFNLATTNGVRTSGGKNYAWDFFEYYNLINFELYPGGEATGNLVFEVPRGQKVLLEFVGVWFAVE